MVYGEEQHDLLGGVQGLAGRLDHGLAEDGQPGPRRLGRLRGPGAQIWGAS